MSKLNVASFAMSLAGFVISVITLIIVLKG
ncbi:hypothetical protein SAMN04488600_101559 [Paenibacillus polymyxa]|uniref:Uncharacterized protein n=1 Tax=Paenibacillus polymyxa TaxID=1406 RepID=A0A378XWR4_PAEPO|nr:hypothetical protein SAMN04488600_101559 [Paenibacillus polymyxa]SUA67574.1 Uncharacterised protein [Paenibacillus polymyxa]